MAFCNACGATLDGGAKFCTKCGATQPLGRTSAAVSPSSAAAATSLATAPKSNNALKVILIVVAVIVGLGILGIAAVSFMVTASPPTPGCAIRTATCAWKLPSGRYKAQPIRTKLPETWASSCIREHGGQGHLVQDEYGEHAYCGCRI